MVDVQPWVIRQLTGSRREITLSGYAAPFGRPRRGAVVAEEIEVREASDQYPGVEEPTRHIFGIRNESFQLHGRWMDGALGGPNRARAMRNDVLSMVKEQLPVDISWGALISATGLLKRLKCSWESLHECAWELEILIDKQLSGGPEPFRQKPVSSYTNQLKAILGECKDAVVEENQGYALKIPIQDALGLIVGSLLQPIADLEALANELKSIKDGTIGQLRRFRAGLGMARRAFNTFRVTFESALPELALEFRSARAELMMAKSQADTARSITEAFALIGEADRAARRAQVQKIRTIFTAKQGDSWESLSLAIYGDASRAQELRETNDVGTNPPTPGETYVAPV